MAIIEESIQYVLTNEGGFNVDNGGPTNFGITIPDVAAYRRINRSMISMDDIKYLTMAEAKDIYKELYWDPMRLDEVYFQNVATAIFDCGVNRGISVGAKYAQRTCNMLGGALLIDGEIGVHTIAAINKCGLSPFIKTFENLEVAGYLAIVANRPDLKLYENGWMNRAKRLFTLIPKPMETFTV